jgi:hypothetical protein
MEIVRSVHGIPIRLTGERWSHIAENHDDLAGRMDDVLDAVERPSWVTRGYGGTLIAWKPYGRGRFLSVIYRELSRSDGFIVTAFFTSKPRKRDRVWP